MHEYTKKLSDENLEEMKRLRNEGMSYNKLAKKFNIALSAVQWRLGTEAQRESIKKRARACWWRHREKYLAKAKAWNKSHKDAQYRSICFSMIRLNLKRGYITKADVLDVLGEFEN